jgi:NAD(P)-dependent dehydrogenase (short-subunit alcohol dehydrogenase family)
VASSHPNTKIIPYPFNVAKEDETLVLIDEVLAAFGRLDVWVCSSGLLGPASLAETTPDDLQQCFEAHGLAPFFALKYAPPAMAKLTGKQPYANAAPKRQKYGSIIVIASVASTYGGCWGPCYTMASHAALGVVRAGVPVLKGTGVRINCISPGQIDVGLDLSGVRSTKTTPRWESCADSSSLKFDMRGMTDQFPPAALQAKEVRAANQELHSRGGGD